MVSYSWEAMTLRTLRFLLGRPERIHKDGQSLSYGEWFDFEIGTKQAGPRTGKAVGVY